MLNFHREAPITGASTAGAGRLFAAKKWTDTRQDFRRRPLTRVALYFMLEEKTLRAPVRDRSRPLPRARLEDELWAGHAGNATYIPVREAT